MTEHYDPHIVESDSEDIVFEEKYWRSFNYDKVIHHAPLTEFFHDHGVGSWVETSPRNPESYKLSRLQGEVRQHGRRNKHLINMIQLITRVCGKFNIDTVTCEDALRFARRLVDVSMVGRDKARALAAIYAALVYNCHPLNIMSEIAEYLGLEWNRAREHYLKKRLYSAGIILRCNNPIKAIVQYINEAANKLKLDGRVRALAETIAVRFGSESAIKATALAALYIAGKLLDLYIRQNDVSEAIGVTDATVRNGLKVLGVKIEYYLCKDSSCSKRILIVDWWPGKDSYGVRRPYEVAVMAGINKYKYRFELPRDGSRTIRVYMWEVNDSQ